MWRHALLEIYSLSEIALPTEGTPADWIAEDKVGWCNGHWADAVAFLPLYKLLFWKARYWAECGKDLLYRLCYWIVPGDDVTWGLGGEE